MTDDRVSGDQAQAPVFRLLLLLQLVTASLFALVPLLVPETVAMIFGYSGDDPVVYRISGAATLGYAVAAGMAYARRASWPEVRVPLLATLTFNVAAVLASVVELAAGGPLVLPLVVLLAGSTFSVVSAYWLRRDEGPPANPGPQVPPGFRPILGLAALAAAVFGLAPLLLGGSAGSLVGLAGTDDYIYRLAGAATLGYAAAGVLELRAAAFPVIRLQNLAAIAFNAVSALAALVAVLARDGGLLAPVVLAAGTLFAIALTQLERRARG